MGMSDTEIDQFLDEKNHLRLATVSENGWPHTVPVAYARLDDRDQLYILTHPSQRKSQNMFHENRVGAVIDDGNRYTNLRGVFIHGMVTAIQDRSMMNQLEQAWIKQCYGGELPSIVKTVYSRRDGWIWFEIDPVHKVSWDNTKVDPQQLADEQPENGSIFNYKLPNDLGATDPGKGA